MLRKAPLLAAMMLLASPATAVQAKAPDAFHGRTAQGISISLGAPSRSGARAFRYRAKLACNDGSSFLDDYFTDAVTVRADHFSASVTSNAGAVSTKITGQLTGTHASGTIRIVEHFSELKDSAGDTPLAADGAIICDSGTVRWTATA